jgi:SAM-dependent methyltransferase
MVRDGAVMTLRDAWERHAEEWIAWARTPGQDHYFWRFNLPRFLELLPSPGRLTVDVGCGEGRLPRELQRLGHRVVGIDSSMSLVRAAVLTEPGLFAVADAGRLPLRSGSADLVVAFMSLQDIDDMAAAVAEAGRALAPGGRFCFAIVHPLTSAGRFEGEGTGDAFIINESYMEAHPVGGRFERAGLSMTFSSYHRPISAYMKALEDAGFTISALRELTPDDDHVADMPKVAKPRRLPLYLHVRAIRVG